MFPQVEGHSLKHWGERLEVLKGNYGENNNWSELTPEMIQYCQQDVRVAESLYKHLMSQNWSQESINLETTVAKVIQKQVDYGFSFDEIKAQSLYAHLCQTRDNLTNELQVLFKPWFVNRGEFTPARDDKNKGYEKGVTFCRIELVVFNPQSGDHVADRLIKLRGWKPSKFTEKTSKPIVNEECLKALDYPEVNALIELMGLKKLIGYIGEGKESWLTSVKKGRIHGRVFTTQTITGRMSHGSPNLAQVPSKAVKWGKECRELFTASKGRVLVGADASSLELRCLAHFMGKYDNGNYAKTLIEGDIHSFNASLLGKPRETAKTFIYAFLYGAGTAKLAKILSCSEMEARKIRTKFLKGLPALDKLLDDVKFSAKKGYLYGLDRRKVYVREEYAALNTLLQSAGALVMKQALCIAHEHNKNLNFVANIHDEFQVDCYPHEAEEIGKLLVESIKEAGKHFNFRCALDGEYKIGNNWAETH
jgi:DNA polymerase-1